MAKSLPQLGPGVALIDSHCHLDDERFNEDRDVVIERARAAGVAQMVTIGASFGIERNYTAIQLAEQYPCVFATVGVHPHDARIVDDAMLTELDRLAQHPKVVGIGETGLDYFYDHSPREQQRETFRRFLGLARSRGLPCVVHLRDAYDDAVQILREERAHEVGGVIHCFSGDRQNARDLLDLGFDLSFSGVVTFKNADELRYVAAMVPADNFMLETDAPYLAPIPFRGKRNEPLYTLCTAEVVAEVRGESLDQVAAAAGANAARRFRLPAERD